MKRLNIKSGTIFGMLKVISENEMGTLPSGQKVRSFKCVCSCGVEKNVKLVHLTNGKIVSCGCKNRSKDGDGGTHLCKLWRSMKYRTSEKGIDKHRYFDRGIKVCDEWAEDYFKFKSWAIENGYRQDLQIDRINNNLGYSPENCRFVTLIENVNNRENTVKVFFDGEHVALKPLLKSLDLLDKYEIIYSRLRAGWDFERAKSEPSKPGRRKKLQIWD
jgi:hypothetical protein